jgi:DNA-binding HxlR family transcriptional regulator
MFENKCTYNDFLKSQEGIATNILASRLKELEENGIIEKSAHPDSKAKNLYRLTSKGIDLLPILIEVYIPADVKVVIQEAKKDKEKFENQIRSILTTLLEMQKASHS